MMIAALCGVSFFAGWLFMYAILSGSFRRMNDAKLAWELRAKKAERERGEAEDRYMELRSRWQKLKNRYEPNV